MDLKFSFYTPARNQSNAAFMMTLYYELEFVNFLIFIFNTRVLPYNCIFFVWCFFVMSFWTPY